VKINFRYFFCVFLLPIALGHDGAHAPGDGLKRPEIEKNVSTYQKQLQKNTSDLNALFHLGELFEKLGRITGEHEDFAKAEHYFRQILAFDPVHKGGLMGLCKTQLAQHGFRTGLQSARSLAEVAPQDLNALLLLGDAHFFLGNYPEADSIFNQAAARIENSGTAARLAQLFETQGKYDLAYKWMGRAYQLVPEAATGDGERAWILTMLAELDLQTGKVDSASESFKKALELEPEMHYAQWRLATIHMHQGRLDQARSILHDLIHTQERVSYMVTYGQLWERLNRPDRAKYWFEKAESRVMAEVASGDVGHMRELVMLWASTGNNLEKALTFAEKEYREVRQDVEGAELLGWLYHLNGRSKEGLPYINRALRLGYSTPRFLLRAGLVNHGAKNYLQAAYLFQIAVKDVPFVSETLLKEARSAKAWLKDNPGAISDQFKKANPTATLTR